MIEILKSKIHRATVTDADIEYEGSITISEELIAAANIKEYEKVLVVDINNGSRFETYVIKTNNPKTICINGAAARLVNIGDVVIIMSFMYCEELPVGYTPTVAKVNAANEIINAQNPCN